MNTILMEDIDLVPLDLVMPGEWEVVRCSTV